MLLRRSETFRLSGEYGGIGPSICSLRRCLPVGSGALIVTTEWAMCTRHISGEKVAPAVCVHWIVENGGVNLSMLDGISRRKSDLACVSFFANDKPMNAGELNMRHLAAMIAVVDQGSVSLAARKVNLTQPAVTQGIAKLEAQLGLDLFDRVPSGMRPTKAALLLLPRVERALQLLGSSRVTATQIRAFVALARAGSYSAAATLTGLTEPSLHRAVADLSLALGGRLVERRGRGLILTRLGEGVARRLRLALSELRQALEELAELRGDLRARILVGAMPLSRARLLPQAIIEFQQLNPHAQISVLEGSHAELVGPLRDGEIDLMIGALRDPSIGEDLDQFPLFEDRPTIFGRVGHPLEGGWNAVDLRRYPWIVPPLGTPLRALWSRMFEAIGDSLPPVPVECGSVMTIRQLLLRSNALTLLSVDQLRVEQDAGLVADIGAAPGDIHRSIGLTCRACWRPTRLQQAFLDILRNVADDVYS
jgi:LysR family transcriptional regulator, regulator for genes of the gallate degradation pathway